jgi:hypothetical protein
MTHLAFIGPQEIIIILMIISLLLILPLLALISVFYLFVEYFLSFSLLLLKFS